MQVDGWHDDLELSDFTTMVVHENLRRTGWFEYSHPIIDRLPEHAVWECEGFCGRANG